MALASIPRPDPYEGFSAAQAAFEADRIKTEDVANYIPTDMTPTDDSQSVARQIADKSVTAFFNSPRFKQSSLGQTSERVQKKMEVNASVGGAEPGEIKHDFKFQMQAFQNFAKVDYSGYLNACFKYYLTTPKMDLEVLENFGKRQLVFNHHLENGDTLNQVMLRWGW